MALSDPYSRYSISQILPITFLLPVTSITPSRNRWKIVGSETESDTITLNHSLLSLSVLWTKLISNNNRWTHGHTECTLIDNYGIYTAAYYRVLLMQDTEEEENNYNMLTVFNLIMAPSLIKAPLNF